MTVAIPMEFHLPAHPGRVIEFAPPKTMAEVDQIIGIWQTHFPPTAEQLAAAAASNSRFGPIRAGLKDKKKPAGKP